jgi:glycosyltransferase involved in cell wall biosynthesis
MTTHPWLAPSAPTVAKVTRGRATAALRAISKILPARLGVWAPAWRSLSEALPALLRADAPRLLAAVSRVDVLPALLDLEADSVEATRLERALITLWLGIAGHQGLTAPLALSGPFHQRVVDPHQPRLLELGDVRGLIATARGPAVIGHEGRRPLDAFAVATLPIVEDIVIVDDRLDPPEPVVVERVRAALMRVGDVLPGGRLERVTIGTGAGSLGEARVGRDVDAADLLASAHAAFVKAAAPEDLMSAERGTLVHEGQRLRPVDVLARACGNASALPWRADRAAAALAIHQHLDDLPLLGDLGIAATDLVAAIRAAAGERSSNDVRRAVLVNVDADDFVYSFQFGRSLERRCVERGLRVDRISIDPCWRRDLRAELGEDIPPPIADGTEMLVKAQDDPSLKETLRRLRERRYEAVVANVRPRLFYDLVEAGLLSVPTLLWDRHLHHGIEEESARRGIDANQLRRLPIRVWSLQGPSGRDLHRGLVDAGLEHGCGRPWPMDLEFFRSRASSHPDRLFAGGDSYRDWPLFLEAVRGLPIDVHLVTRHAPAELPSNVRLETRLPLWRFRDDLAAAAVTAIPLIAGAGASGVTVLPMAMALGVAVVATRTTWTEQYVTDGEEGLLVPAGDVAAFRTALIRLHEESDLRAHLVQNARRRVAEMCDLEAFTREMFATLG